MAQAETTQPQQTVLHDWHVEAGGRMVEFGGWDMPVQYPSGIVQEHLSTRRAAGLFDVSHMGRFRVRGAGAEAFLMQALTNNAQALDPDQAQYTFIANETGGAVDDAYLYRLAAEDFLLVVNAGNRSKDWDWLEALKSDDVEFIDESEELGMIALQGPEASNVLERIVDVGELPEDKRNRLRLVPIDGQELIIARTGYTGEAICFEIFPPRDLTVSFWQMLIDAGALPIGLGARDSLRLEAGLPLYGHELGLNLEGDEIPIFANRLARFGVRPPGGQDYVGRVELEKQREEYVRILRHEIDVPVEDRILTHLIQPIAAFADRKPLRSGFRVSVDGAPAGYVTSGTSAPYSDVRGQDVSVASSDPPKMRPIGLALLRSDILYVAEHPVSLDIEDMRGNRISAELVDRNL